MVTQTGGRPGPPGLSASSAVGESPRVVSPWVDRPASERKADGLASRCSDHGNSTKNGVTTTMAAFTGSTAMSHRLRGERADREHEAEHPGERRERGGHGDEQAGRPGRARAPAVARR